ncbi:MAG TPA: YcxB family protein [Geothrix sp.]|nr:YcxB family protein [Geothrix sp.]
MQISTRYALTPDEALRGSRAFKRLWYAVSVGSGALVTLLGVAVLAASRGQAGFGLFMIFNGLLFLIMPEAVLRWARRRRGLSAYSSLALRLDDEGLSLETEASEGGLPWDAFTEIRRRGGFWIFRAGPSQAVLVPERALDAAASAELEAFLRGRELMGQ